jgi:hypothetical protein
MKHPCIRNLEPFKETGCPRNDDCPCWITDFYIKDGKKVTTSQCLDLWRYVHEREMLRLLEGNQAATESMRNGLCEQDEEGKTVPKAIRMTLIKKVSDERLSTLSHIQPPLRPPA